MQVNSAKIASFGERCSRYFFSFWHSAWVQTCPVGEHHNKNI